MKMLEEAKHLRKEYVYEQYSRIVPEFKDYERITKTKMIEAIYKIYSDYNNIISICTTRELKFLKKVLNNKINYKVTIPEDFDFFKAPEEELIDLLKQKKKVEQQKKKTNWERQTLIEKYLIRFDYENDKLVIPEEIIEPVKQALKHVDWNEKEKIDDLNEITVSYVKILGSTLIVPLIQFVSGVTDLNEEIVNKHIFTDKLLHYYLFIMKNDLDDYTKDIPMVVYQEYLDYYEELKEQRKKYGMATSQRIDIDSYKTIFYNDIDINNPVIKKFLQALEKEVREYYIDNIIRIMRICALLNDDREFIKEYITSCLKRSGYFTQMLDQEKLDNLLILMDEAMNEMPSGAINGLTPNEAVELNAEKQKYEQKKIEQYQKQENACLSKKDTKSFYKLYFALLEFTNQKYKINPNYKIYKQQGINPQEIINIIKKFWENKNKIILEFCMSNPYKFTKEEIKFLEGFKKGIHDTFVLVKYEKDYTLLMKDGKIYMVKGLNDNIDSIITYDELPCFVTTSLIEFNGNIVYDGIISSYPISFGINFVKTIEKEYNESIKYYHL